VVRTQEAEAVMAAEEKGGFQLKVGKKGISLGIWSNSPRIPKFLASREALESIKPFRQLKTQPNRKTILLTINGGIRLSKKIQKLVSMPRKNSGTAKSFSNGTGN